MVGTMIIMAAYDVAAVGLLSAGQMAAAFAINFAVSQIVTRVFGQDLQPPQDNGVRQQIPPSSTNAIPVAYGDAYMGGTFVDAVISTDQKTMYYVLAISSISPNGQFTFDTTKFYYGDRLITFDTTDLTKVVSLSDEAIPANVDTKISGNLYISLYKSSSTGTITSLNGAAAPSTVMGGTDIAVAQRWPSTGRQMNGLAFAIVKLNYSQDAGTTSLSPITFYCKHYLNNTGCAKPGDVWYDYLTSTIYGGAIPTAYADSASVTTLNAYSDELITFKNSSGVASTQARYRMNGVLDAGQTVLTNLDKIMSCCDSWMTYNAATGQWSVVVNKTETAAFAFNDDNIIGEIRVSATDITSSINQVEAKFPFKDNRDQPAYVQLATPSNLLYPNEPTNKYSITYDLVNDSVQASYLANRLLEQAREDLIVSFNTTYYGIQVDAGSVISVTNSAYGWTNKLFRVMKVNEASLPDGSLGAKLELSEYNAAVYDNLDVTAFTPSPNSNIPSVTYFSALAAPTVAGYPTGSAPYFDVTATLPTTGRVTGLQLFYTTVATPTAADWSLLATATSSNTQPFTNGATYVFSDLMLGAGTYYFAFNVSNDIGKSALSSISTSFVWTPVSGFQQATAIVYRWSATAPTISGTSTYTWATGTVSSPPTNWSATISNTGTAGQTLWAAKVDLNDSVSNTTSTINWSLATIVPFGYVGTTGASTRIAYTATSTTLSTTPNSYTIAGDNLPATGTWGTGIVWSSTVPTLSAGQSVWQTEGVYNPTNNQTIWGYPYLSSQKIGNLSAVSTNTGSLTVTGTFQSNTALVSGTTMTGSGGIIYPNGNFAFGNTSTNISYNGTQMTLNGNVVATGNINLNAVTSISSATSSTGTVSLTTSLNAGDSVVILTVADSCLLSVGNLTGNDLIKAGTTTLKSVASYFGRYVDGFDNQFSVYPATTVAINATASSTASYTLTGTTATYGTGYAGNITIILLVTKR